MKILYLDCFAGISGDMFLGLLLDLGLKLDVLSAELSKLPMQGYQLQADRMDKRGIQAVQFKVMLMEPGGAHLADSEFIEVDPTRSPAVQDKHHTAHAGEADQTEHAHRSLPEILAVIQNSALSDRVKNQACAIFTRLAEAEGQVHGSPADQVQFHEVGGTDAIVDIVGAAIGLEQLAIESVYASPLPLGSGFIRSAHGLYPLPGPATANLLRGVPVYTTQANGEMVTPTGAAIITSLAQGFGPMPAMTVQAVGYGAGTRQREFPNVLRGFLGESYSPSGEASFGARTGRDPYPQQHQVPTGEPGYHQTEAVVIETNIDDMNPQLFENLSDRLLAAGALDVVLIPVQMKKGRPGMLLQVLAYPTSVDVLLEIVFSESTSIGARTYPVTKHMLQRETRLVETPYGRVRLKLAWLGERLVNVAPEYEDCREIAFHKGVPLKEVISAAMAAAWQAIQQPPAGEDSTQPG
jgi:hypothetical protein